MRGTKAAWSLKRHQESIWVHVWQVWIYSLLAAWHFIRLHVNQLQCCCCCCSTQVVLLTMSQGWLWSQLLSSSSKLPSHSNCRVFPRRCRLLLEVCWPFDTRFPALWLALRLGELDHEKGQDHHGSKEGKHRNGLTNFLVIATWHYP